MINHFGEPDDSVALERLEHVDAIKIFPVSIAENSKESILLPALAALLIKDKTVVNTSIPMELHVFTLV